MFPEKPAAGGPAIAASTVKHNPHILWRAFRRKLPGMRQCLRTLAIGPERREILKASRAEHSWYKGRFQNHRAGQSETAGWHWSPADSTEEACRFHEPTAC